MYLRIQPFLHRRDLVLADNDLRLGIAAHVDPHLTEEVGREFLDSRGIDDELAVEAHETHQVELALHLVETHVQQVTAARERAQSDCAVADQDVAHLRGGDDDILVRTMRDQKALPVSDRLSPDRGDGNLHRTRCLCRFAGREPDAGSSAAQQAQDHLLAPQIPQIP